MWGFAAVKAATNIILCRRDQFRQVAEAYLCERKMSFRKRNIGLSPGIARGATPNAPGAQLPSQPRPQPVPGIRPSPVDGRQTTSTGTLTLDNILAGHAGLPLGSSLLIEENGTTDFAGALLRYYAAEGIVQEQRIHVVGFTEQWGGTLPGLIGPAEAADEKPRRGKEEKMKIAWRYERLGQFGVAGSRGERYRNWSGRYRQLIYSSTSSRRG